jgi:hypothetical protein
LTVVKTSTAALALHREIAPSGVLIVSEVPFIESRWWDNPWLHLIWSYASWTSLILEGYGWSAPRRCFNRWWQR